jgi:hypothetical protein
MAVLHLHVDMHLDMLVRCLIPTCQPASFTLLPS